MAESNAPTGNRTPLPANPPQKPAAANAVTGTVARLPSQALFAGAQEVEIVHNGAVYRLRQTSLGKLILTK